MNGNVEKEERKDEDDDIVNSNNSDIAGDTRIGSSNSCLMADDDEPGTSAAESTAAATTTTTTACQEEGGERTTTALSAYAALKRAFVRSPFEIDYTQIALVPPMRTAVLMLVEWCVFGVGNPTSSAFQLACLYVGFADTNGSMGYRLRYMGTTLVCVVLIGALLPALIWNQSAIVNVVVAFFVALGTGLSPFTGSAALSLATKLGAALFAINGGVMRNNQGYGGNNTVATSVFFTFLGGISSLAFALLPEVIGNRDAIRADLFRVWNGFGRDLVKWNGSWGTVSHLSVSPTPTITLSIAKTARMVSSDTYIEEEGAKKWLVDIMECADTIRAGCLCLTNISRTVTNNNNRKFQQKDVDDFFIGVGRACRSIAFVLQFPWVFRCLVPFATGRRFVDRPVFTSVADSSAALLRKMKMESNNTSSNGIDGDALSQHHHQNGGEDTDGGLFAGDNCIPSLVNLIQTQVESVAMQVGDASSWPRYSPPTSIPKRLAAAFGRPAMQKDESWLIRSYAIRFAIAFAIATIPEVTIQERVSAHWFPMTVALIMGPTHAATYQRVAHRTIGTLLGIGLGAALAPLFGVHNSILIAVLGLNTYAAVVFFSANYTMFTFFITGWVFIVVVGPGGSLGMTTVYRCLWTLSAGALVILVVYVYPPKVHNRVGDNLAAMAEAVKAYAEAAVENNSLRQQVNDEQMIVDVDIYGAAEAARRRLDEARQGAIQARLAMLGRINEAMFTPDEVLEPDSLASNLASDLIDATIIPQSVSLVAANGGNAADLLSDIDQDTYNEIDRLIARFKLNVNLTTARRRRRSGGGKPITRSVPNSTQQQQQQAAATPPTIGRGPFSNAIARAHQRLDEAGIPCLTTASLNNDEHTTLEI